MALPASGGNTKWTTFSLHGYDTDTVLSTGCHAALQADVDVAPNPEEVDAVRYVTLAELQDMMRPEHGLRWSPWFRIIAEHFLAAWWKDLDAILEGDGPLDPRIHKIM